MNHWLHQRLNQRLYFIGLRLFNYNWLITCYADNGNSFMFEYSDRNNLPLHGKTACAKIHGDDREDWIRQILEQLA